MIPTWMQIYFFASAFCALPMLVAVTDHRDSKRFYPHSWRESFALGAYMMYVQAVCLVPAGVVLSLKAILG